MPVMPERRTGLEPAADGPELDVRNARFTALFRAEYGYVWGSLRRFGVNERDAEDVAHEVFMRVYDKLDVLDRSRPARPWLFSFVYRAACDYRKLAQHRVEVMEERDAASDARSAEQMLERVDDARLVSAALECLEFERRTVLIAFEMDEVPMKTIAEATGVPLFTAYSRLRLAREDFRAVVERLRRREGIT
jgi:RNA polymerase sigma-70 factor (ECF subfamily)